MRWALSWVLCGIGDAVYWFDMETWIGSQLYQWTGLPLWRVERALAEASERVQGKGAGPWVD